MNQNHKLPDAMTDPPTCPACGAPLAQGRSGEMCPACLLHAAMGADLPDQSASPGAGVVGEHGFPSIAERLGARIGRYKLLEQIGEGGFGVVWMAEQEEPVRRRVALKIIKPGMDTREVVARFEAERQALAMMEHPNIASVFDGGATDTGRPYFVMELVKGVPITTYCDANQLTTRERLELFMEVCQAVQHAHQKGVIHRDLKPSNILVTVKDDRAVPKVIDFGVAKATQARLTGENALHPPQPVDRHARIHEPGTGGPGQPGRGHPQRHLFARRAALRIADRPPALRHAKAAGRRLRRGDAHDPRGGAAQAEHAAQHPDRGGTDRRGRQTRRRSRPSSTAWCAATSTGS